MAVIQSYTVEGFPELFAAMNDLKEEIGKQKTDRLWRSALTAAMQPVLKAAQAAAPKDTGQLAQHIYLKVQRPQRRDKTSKYYDGEEYMARVSVSPIREDTKDHFTLNKRGKFQHVYRNKKPVAVSQEFGNARVTRHPFMRLSLENNAQLVTSILEGRLAIIIAEVARAKNRRISAEGK